MRKSVTTMNTVGLNTTNSVRRRLKEPAESSWSFPWVPAGTAPHGCTDSPSRKTAEQLLVLSRWCPSVIKLSICFLSVSKMKVFLPSVPVTCQVVNNQHHHVFHVLWSQESELSACTMNLSYTTSALLQEKVKVENRPCLQALWNNGLIFLPPIIALDKYQVCRIII